jgi:hypothetical protein
LSRPRSGRGASTGAGRAAAQRGVYVQTPKSDIYVALLGVALGAMIIGCIFLLLVLNRYGFSTQVTALSSPPRFAIARLDTAAPFGKIDTVRL